MATQTIQSKKTKHFIYLSPEWKVTKINLDDTDLIDWFSEKRWTTETTQLHDEARPAAVPEITILVTGWYKLIIYVKNNTYHVKLASELILGLAIRSIEAIVTSEEDLHDILYFAQLGKKKELLATLRPLSVKRGLSTRIATVMSLTLIVVIVEFAFQSHQLGQNKERIKSIDQLQPLDVNLLQVDYQPGGRNKPDIFHLTAIEYPSRFYTYSGFPIEIRNPKSTIATIVNTKWTTPAKIHIPKAYMDSLYVDKLLIPIYSLTINSREYIAPEFAIKVGIASEDELVSFVTWWYSSIFFILALSIRYRAAGNLFGSL